MNKNLTLNILIFISFGFIINALNLTVVDFSKGGIGMNPFFPERSYSGFEFIFLYFLGLLMYGAVAIGSLFSAPKEAWEFAAPVLLSSMGMMSNFVFIIAAVSIRKGVTRFYKVIASVLFVLGALSFYLFPHFYPQVNWLWGSFMWLTGLTMSYICIINR